MTKKHSFHICLFSTACQGRSIHFNWHIKGTSQTQSLGVTKNDKCATDSLKSSLLQTHELLYHDNYSINVKYGFR